MYSVIGIAGLSLLIFIAIYFTVVKTVYGEVDKDLFFEAEKHKQELSFTQDSLYFTYKDEWLEREHLEVEVYPLFVELFDKAGNSLDKSPNLQGRNLKLSRQQKEFQIVNTTLGAKKIRQIQFKLQQKDKIKGYLIIAAPLDHAEMVLNTLKNTLLFIYPILLIITFFTSRLISNITIRPIRKIAKSVNEINTNNLNERVPVNINGDELETLSTSINDFLDRIDESIKREKRFTANASHQLRTPLAVLKGNLEVLVRKPRSNEEYIKTIRNNIEKIDAMADAVEKLLILARLNNQNKQQIETETFSLIKMIKGNLEDYKKQIIQKKLRFNINEPENDLFTSNKTYLNFILDNLISNAVKYAFENTLISIKIIQKPSFLNIEICNKGPKIQEDEFNEIFNPFYRNKTHENSEKGFGIGLAILNKASRLLNAEVKVTSFETTCFSIKIPNKS